MCKCVTDPGPSWTRDGSMCACVRACACVGVCACMRVGVHALTWPRRRRRSRRQPWTRHHRCRRRHGPPTGPAWPRPPPVRAPSGFDQAALDARHGTRGTRTRTHTRTHTRACSRAHTHMHARAHTHMQARRSHLYKVMQVSLICRLHLRMIFYTTMAIT